MFSRLSIASLFTFAVLAAATPGGHPGTTTLPPVTTTVTVTAPPQLRPLPPREVAPPDLSSAVIPQRPPDPPLALSSSVFLASSSKTSMSFSVLTAAPSPLSVLAAVDAAHRPSAVKTMLLADSSPSDASPSSSKALNPEGKEEGRN
ncbi:hypothetical protein D9757_008861 [Collybiopsis confluens]|uniref:Secreted protein n=1 Tax=Collybiopsis confluens TaxID=2823264 RepID=A0A8H5H2Y1_9AGAR|nr:hypothetical protein D9757_008861 [Collybiopsis confluens]